MSVETSFLVFDEETTAITVEGDADLLVIEGGVQGPQGFASLGLPTFVHGGLLVPLVGAGKIPNDTGRVLTLGIIRASVEVPCVGGPIIVDFVIDGVSLGVPLTLVEGAATTFVDADLPWPTGTFLGVNVPQVGSVYAGYTLTVSAVAR